MSGKPLDRKVFGKGMALLGAAFPENRATKETLDLYYDRLKGFTPKEFETAVMRWIDNGRFFPKVSELRESLNELKRWNKPTAAEVWQNVIRAAERNQPPPDDDATTRAIQAACGSFEKLGLMSYRDLDFAFSRFKETYNTLQDSGDERRRLSQEKGTEVKQIEGGA